MARQRCRSVSWAWQILDGPCHPWQSHESFPHTYICSMNVHTYKSFTEFRRLLPRIACGQDRSTSTPVSFPVQDRVYHISRLILFTCKSTVYYFVYSTDDTQSVSNGAVFHRYVFTFRGCFLGASIVPMVEICRWPTSLIPIGIRDKDKQ
jgi:hypothetical protein